MVRAWRKRSGTGMVSATPEPGPAEQLGILPCDALGCLERTGIACDHIDSRGRFCVTAWCPDHRHTLGERSFCAIHAARATGMTEWLREPAAAAVTWFALAAEDDIVSVLNEIGVRAQAVCETEALRATADAAGNRVWQLSWRLRSRDGILGRISLSATEDALQQVHLSVDDAVIRSIDIPPLCRETSPQNADLTWLMREIYAPIRASVGLHGGDGETTLTGAARAASHAGRAQ